MRITRRIGITTMPAHGRPATASSSSASGTTSVAPAARSQIEIGIVERGTTTGNMACSRTCRSTFSAEGVSAVGDDHRGQGATAGGDQLAVSRVAEDRLAGREAAWRTRSGSRSSAAGHVFLVEQARQVLPLRL